MSHLQADLSSCLCLTPPAAHLLILRVVLGSYSRRSTLVSQIYRIKSYSRASGSPSVHPLPCFISVGFARFLLSHFYIRPSFSLSLAVLTYIRGHIGGSSTPLPSTVRALHFCREKISSPSSPVDSRRIVLTPALSVARQLVRVECWLLVS